jgi:hypothetical protein
MSVDHFGPVILQLINTANQKSSIIAKSDHLSVAAISSCSQSESYGTRLDYFWQSQLY